MADSLDDFFAKKDKKRGKDKGKTVLSAEALVRELEEGSKQIDYPVRKENKTSTAIELLGLDADDADWRDFDEVEKRDYTGLKVKEMSLQDQTDEEQRRLCSEQSEPVTESTPWKLKDETSNPSESASSANKKTDAEKSAQSTSKSDTTPVSKEQASEQEGKTAQATTDPTGNNGDKESAKPKGKYVPPGQRNAPSSELGEVRVLAPTRLSKIRGSAAGPSGSIPNIQDTQMFPSLG